MFKLYKWLVYIIIRPYKKLQHFRNCFAILFSRSKTNTESKIEKERQRSYLAPTGEAKPAHQVHPTWRGAHASSSPPGRQEGRRRALCCRQAAACVPRAYPLARRRLG